ncbi:hypothetical protein HK100_001899 [Physocladia obscura]|uniref:Rhodanese domain-containing protein n=1 Tax=Physocladia obscura TaxID=109957 RepID=A0AAD5XE74_9FUNG|nr:hypothetical protein HK100_001899 [Physocladia obscura]
MLILIEISCSYGRKKNKTNKNDYANKKAPTSNLFATYVSKLRENVKEVSVDDVAAALKAGPKPTFHLFDVRETTEWNEGRIPQAFYTGRGNLERDIEHYAPDVFDDIVLYCAGGVRSIIAADALQRMGYKNVSSLVGGYGAWKSAGKEIVVPRGKTYSDREEY